MSLGLYGEETVNAVAIFLSSLLKVSLSKWCHCRMVPDIYFVTEPRKYAGINKIRYFSTEKTWAYLISKRFLAGLVCRRGRGLSVVPFIQKNTKSQSHSESVESSSNSSSSSSLSSSRSWNAISGRAILYPSMFLIFTKSSSLPFTLFDKWNHFLNECLITSSWEWGWVKRSLTPVVSFTSTYDSRFASKCYSKSSRTYFLNGLLILTSSGCLHHTKNFVSGEIRYLD